MKSMKRWLGYAWLLVVLWAGVWVPDAGAQDARNTMAAKTLMTRSSPFDPPMNGSFRHSNYTNIDQTAVPTLIILYFICHLQTESQHPLYQKY